MEKLRLSVLSEDAAKRLDLFASLKSGLSRTYVQKLITEGLLLVNSRSVKGNYRIKQGDLVELAVPAQPELTLVPEDVPLDVVWEDDHIIVINKPPRMVIYPAAGHTSGTLLNALVSRCGKLALTGSPLRPGVVHRLDRDTSGLIVFAKDDRSYANLVRQFSQRLIEKTYLALVYGHLMKNRGEIRAPIGRAVSDRKKMSLRTRKGREAVTLFEVMERLRSSSLVRVRIITGRTHQIRVHFAASGHPVLGDRTYGRKTALRLGDKTVRFSRQMLHASGLAIRHPVTGRTVRLTAPLPADMQQAINDLSDNDG